MNKAEKRFLTLVLVLFALGWVSRLGALTEWSSLQPVELPQAAVDEPASAVSSGSSTGSDSLQVAVAPTPAKVSSKKKPLSAPMSINRATAAELCRIKGVGPALAGKIIEYRTRKGPFRSARDLDKVPGIGDKKLKAICEWVIFD